ncbi:MAG: nuclear transport factor 2 family protein [Solirubrobacteraceae bacterium]
MGAQENLEIAKRGYAAFTSGDVDGAMANLADDVEWVTPGRSAISGTARGKQEVGANWAKLAEKGFTTSPQHWFADDERVVVLAQVSVSGQSWDAADVLTFSNGKVIRFQTAGDTALLEQSFPSS